MDKRKGALYGAVISLLFHSFTISEIFIATLIFDHADAAVILQIILCILLLLFYNLIENKLCKVHSSSVFAYDLSFLLISILSVFVYMGLVHSSLTKEYLERSVFLSGLEYIIALMIYIIAIVLIILIRLISIGIGMYRKGRNRRL